LSEQQDSAIVVKTQYNIAEEKRYYILVSNI